MEHLDGDVSPEKKEKKEPRIANTTSRHIVTKLELPTAEAVAQLKVVSKKVFDLEMPDHIQYAKENSKWHATDEVYNTAKDTYESVITPFTELPKLYKLESTRDKVIQYRMDIYNADKPKSLGSLKSSASSRYLDRARRTKSNDQFLPDEEEEVDTDTGNVLETKTKQ